MVAMAIHATTDVETHQATPVPWCKPTNERETNKNDQESQ